MANDTPTLPSPTRGGGLGRAASCFCSRDIGRIWRVAEALEYGIEQFPEVKYLCMGGIDRQLCGSGAPTRSTGAA